jgi:membrane-associated phospholipid phosphatase
MKNIYAPSHKPIQRTLSQLVKMVFCLMVLTTFAANRVFAADESILTSDHFASNALDHFLGDAIGGFYNPIRQEPNWWGLGTVGVTALGSYLLYKQLDDDSVGETVITSDETYGDIVNGLSYAAYAMPAIFLGSGFLFSKDDPRRHRLWIVAEEIFETLGFELATNYAIKLAVDRQNPSGLGSNSFPSGHTAAAFSVATILAYHYPWYVGLGSFSAATLIVIERFDSQQHFPSDIVAGAGIAMFFAHAVHQYHASKRNCSPFFNGEQFGLTWNF